MEFPFTQETVERVIKDYDLEIRIRETYHGRNGARGIGFETFRTSEVTRLWIGLAAECDAEDVTPEDMMDVVDRQSMDQMGRDVIVYYTNVSGFRPGE